MREMREMAIRIEKTSGACGAAVTGLNLSEAISDETISVLRAAWLEHHVLVFPEQKLSNLELERFTTYFGEFGFDPFIASIEDHEHIIALARKADETASIFADSWHTDWSFQEMPPAGTCLYGITVPPVGGNTFFINQHKVLADMPAELRAQLEGKIAIHSAAAGYAPDGLYGDKDQDNDRTMDIKFSEDAWETQEHPIIRPHPESGEEMIYGCLGYIQGFKGMSEDDSRALLFELYHWQIEEAFQYSHKWSPDMLVMWDNRSVLHKASGGYEGHARLMHRTTIADKVRSAVTN
ncbi:MAG: taurine dioxygenase [Flavobacterium sp.]|jgi:taurine dioxygenase